MLVLAIVQQNLAILLNAWHAGRSNNLCAECFNKLNLKFNLSLSILTASMSTFLSRHNSFRMVFFSCYYLVSNPPGMLVLLLLYEIFLCIKLVCDCNCDHNVDCVVVDILTSIYSMYFVYFVNFVYLCILCCKFWQCLSSYIGYCSGYCVLTAMQ